MDYFATRFVVGFRRIFNPPKFHELLIPRVAQPDRLPKYPHLSNKLHLIPGVKSIQKPTNRIVLPDYRVLRDYTSDESSPSATLSVHSFQPDFVPRYPKTKAKKYKYPAFYDACGPKAPPADNIVQIAEKIASLPLKERLQISLALRDKVMNPKLQPIFVEEVDFGTQQAGSSSKAEEKKVEKTTFNVKLEKFDAGVKLKIIKVRSITDLGLKEVDDLVEKAPVILRQQVSKDEANSIINKMKAVGGVAVME